MARVGQRVFGPRAGDDGTPRPEDRAAGSRVTGSGTPKSRAARGRAVIGGTWWQNSLTMEVGRIETLLRASLPADVPELPPLAERVCEQLQQAKDVLHEYDRLGRMSSSGHGGKTYETALSHVLQAGQDLLLLAPAPAVLAQIPGLRAAVRTYLSASDPRFDSYARYCDQLLEQRREPGRRPHLGTVAPAPVPTTPPTPVAPATVVPEQQPPEERHLPERNARAGRATPPAAELSLQDRYMLREIKRTVDDARMSAQTSVRSYRNVLSIAVAVLCLAALTFPLGARWLSDDLLSIRAPVVAASTSPSGASQPAAPGTATSPDRVAQATETAPVRLGDVASIEAWGVIGGLVGAVVSLRRLRSSRDPAGLHLVQLSLKIPAGALTALFGVILLQSSIFPQLTAVHDNQLAAYAVLFGFAQEALTRFVDQKSGEILDNAKPPGSRSSGTTST